MKSLGEYHLIKNPFQNITPTPGLKAAEQPRWAGMPILRESIQRVYNSLFNNSPRQVVLNWGPYGGGKTFAAYYFIEQIEHEELVPKQIYVRSPKIGNRANQELYKNILDYISFRQIRKQVKYLLDIMGEDDLFDFLNGRLRSEEIVEAILKLGTDVSEEQKLMNRYIYDGLTKSELKIIGLAKNIEYGTDSIKFLAGILLCYIGDQDKYKGRVVLWVDEMEDMIYYSQKEYRAFSQVLRDLIDQLNEYFTVFFNFTLAESEEQTIELLLGAAMWSRIDKKIRFSELTEEGALEYCRDLIEQNQVDGSKGDYYPFSKEILQLILSLIPEDKQTPREINRYCRSVLDYARESEQGEIDKGLVAECFERLAENE